MISGKIKLRLAMACFACSVSSKPLEKPLRRNAVTSLDTSKPTVVVIVPCPRHIDWR